MRTVGQILREARLEKEISLEEAEIATKIRRGYLQFLEENNFQNFASVTTARGLLKNYAEFLGFSSREILAIFRRDFEAKEEKKKIIPQALVEPINKSKIVLSPRLTLIIVVMVFLGGLFSYLGLQYLSLFKAPSLNVVFPQDKLQTTEKKIEVLGRADPDSLVTLNGNLISISSKGEFQSQLDLFPGENKIVIEARSKKGKTTKIERTIFRLDNNQ